MPVIETSPLPLPVAPKLYPDLSNVPEMAETTPYIQPSSQSMLRHNLKKPMKRIQTVPVPLKTKVIPTLTRSGQPIQNIVTKHQLQQLLAKKSCSGGKICVVQPTTNPPLQPLQVPVQPSPTQNIFSPPPAQVQLPQASKPLPSRRGRGLNCGICGANFARAWNLTRHMQNIHSKEMSSDIGYQKCVICNQKFGNVGELQRHIVEVHNIQDSDDSSDEEMAVSASPSQSDTPKREIQIEKNCSFCNKSFRYRAQLNEHIKKEHETQSDSGERFSSWTEKNPKKRTTSAAKLTKNDPYFQKFFRGKKQNYPVWNPKK